MDFLSAFLSGFHIALDPMNLFYCFSGAILGTLIGVLPGLGPAPTIALLLPITFRLGPVQSTIMLAGIYYGAMYGGSTTSILVNIPGEAASVVTCLDGYEMAKKGRAGPALGIAAIGSFIGGTVATFGLVLVALPLARFALKFGPPEYFSLLCVGLSLVMGLAGKSLTRALMMGILGLLLSLVGVDPV
ncbi:MAG: tripartite tricarboxylate transporter permease, partial [Thermodesulfobacteriota bacterium]